MRIIKKHPPHITNSASERGQSLVEMAISLIIILILLAGAVDFGIALYSYVAIRDAAQEGVLIASIAPDNVTEIEKRVWTASDQPVDLANDTTVTVTIIIADISATPPTRTEVPATSATADQACEEHDDPTKSHMIQVDVGYTYFPFMPILPDLLGIRESGIPLTASVTDAILRPPCP